MSADHPPSAEGDLGDWPGREFGLSARESAAIALITHGLSNDEIARKMYISVNTLKAFVRTAYRKIGVNTRPRAVLWGIDDGFRSDSIRAMAPHGRH